MGFLDKIKDLFSDEEEVVETKEIEVEEKEEHKLPTFMRNKIEEEQKREEARKVREEREEPVPKTNVISDREIVKTRTSNNFAFPIDMDDSDLVPDIRFDANLRLLVKTVCVHQNEDKTLDVRLEFNGDFEDSVAVYMEIKTGIRTAYEKIHLQCVCQ